MIPPESADELAALRRLRTRTANGSAKAIRVAAHITRNEAARAAQVTATSIYRWERGDTLPSGPSGVRYARFLDGLLRDET